MEAAVHHLLKKIRLLPGKKLNSLFLGEYHSAFRGHGLEFSSVREYQYGDDIKNIDWNVSARMNSLFIKEYVEERELSVVLLLDVSASQNFGSFAKDKKEVMMEIASLFLYMAQMNNDRVSVLMFSDRVEKYIPPRKGGKFIVKILNEIMNHSPSGRGTDISSALEFIGRVQKKRSIIPVISDFIDSGDYMTRLRLMSRKHDIIPVRIFDPEEKKTGFLGLTEFVDLETGRTYLSQALPEASALRDFTGLDCISLSTASGIEKPVLDYFKRRNRKLK